MRMHGRPGIAIKSALAPLLVAIFALGACAWGDPDSQYPGIRTKGQDTPAYEDPDSIFGEGGVQLGGTERDPGDAGGGLGVNSFLWRASLDTIAFMPLVSADPFGGVIITDWYTPPQAPNERFKINVYILGRALRADGIRAAVFRQQQAAAGWVDAPVAPNTATDIENAILTRARQLRIAQLGE
jgi:hypothetical protein